MLSVHSRYTLEIVRDKYFINTDWIRFNNSLKCILFITVYSENAVQLIGGVTDNEGRLQVYKFGRWRSVCFNELDDKLSAVVCRSLDLPW